MWQEVSTNTGRALKNPSHWDAASQMPMDRSSSRAGFTTICMVSHRKGTSRLTERKHIRARESSLTSIPQRYPMIPNLGMAKSTKARRTAMAKIFCKKVVEVASKAV